MEAVMYNSIPLVELPEFATPKEILSYNIELARDAVSMRVGYEVELAGLETIEREGHSHLRLHWRRKSSSVTLTGSGLLR
jgi:hypothetical protein